MQCRFRKDLQEESVDGRNPEPRPAKGGRLEGLQDRQDGRLPPGGQRWPPLQVVDAHERIAVAGQRACRERTQNGV